MNRDDIAKMIYLIKATYPNHFKAHDSQGLKDMLEAWTMVFEDKDRGEAFKGLKIFLNTDTKGFPPSPGQIIDCMGRLETNTLPNEMEAWSMVDKAVRNSGYDAAEEFNKLPQIIRRVVRNPARLKEWALMDSADYMTVEQSNFMRSYRAEKEREEQNRRIPQSIRPALGEIHDTIPEIEARDYGEKGETPDEALEALFEELGNS